MIGIQGLSKSFGARTLFEDVTLTLSPGKRYGLVGANGSGKTTLLKILSGDEPASDGTISLPKGARVGVLRQDRFVADTERIIDVAMMGDEQVWAAMQEQVRLHADGKSSEAAELEERIRLLGGYTLESRAGAVLAGLGIEQRVHAQPVRVLSGGFKLRVQLAQVLLGRPDLLLLDEPTNHLDILSIRWLEKFLGSFEGCAVIISHDQRFLDNVVTHVLDVDYETVTEYPGNFSKFVVSKEEVRTLKEAAIQRQEEIIAHKREFIDRFGAKATKARQAQSRLKQIEKIEVEELKNTSRRSPRLKFVQQRPSGKDVLTAEHVSKAYIRAEDGEVKRVLTDVNLTIRRGERVGVIGANGLGKSTLLKILVDRLEADDGEVKWGHETHVGYFPQDHHEVLVDGSKTVLDTLWDKLPLEGTAYVRGQLGLALFSGNDVEKKVSSLSGGEAARLLFATISALKPNVLVLDEPTNHLDLEAIEALAAALVAYEGTVIFVSHDRWFVSKVASRIVEIKDNGIVDFPGTYAEYLERLGDDHLDRDVVLKKAKEKDRDGKTGSVPPPAAKKGAPQGPPPTTWEDAKKKRNRFKAAKEKRDKVTQDLEKAEARLKEIRDGYGDPNFYMKTPDKDIQRIAAEEKNLGKITGELMIEWEMLEIEIAELATALGETA
ncbi:MAG: ATP-binding cassette domain-containing protein [Polyangiaceae bacterium]